MKILRHFLASFCLASLATTVAAQCVKRMAWATNEPYIFKGQDGNVHGLSADLVREALARVKCKVEFIEMPWGRSLVELQTGRIDLLSGAADTPERKTYAYFSQPTNRSRNVLFVRRGLSKKYQLKHLADIIGTDFRLGHTYMAMYGGDYDKLVNQPEFAARLRRLSTRDNAWQLLAAGRLDGQIEDEASGAVQIRKLQLEDKVEKSSLIIESDFDRVAISKANNTEAFVKEFDDALTKMVNDGTYRKLFEVNLRCRFDPKTLGCAN